MTIAATLTPTGGQVILKRSDTAAGQPLDGLLPLFDGPFDQAATLTITQATSGPGLLAGTIQWGQTPASIEIGFDTTQILSLALKRQLAEGGTPWDLGVTFSAVTETFSATRSAGDLLFDTVLDTSARFGQITIDVRAEAMDADRLRLDFTVEGKGLGLADIVHLVGQDAHPDGDLQWLPETLRTASLVRLDRLSVTLEPSLSRPVAVAEIDLSFAGAAWPVIQGLAFPTLQDLKAELRVDHPLEPDLRFAEITLSGAVLISSDPKSTVEITARWPNLSLAGRLEPGGQIDFFDTLAHHGLPELADRGPSPLVLTRLDITGQPTGKRKRFALTAEVSKPAGATTAVSVPLSRTAALELDDLTFSITWGSEFGQSARIDATCRFTDSSGQAGNLDDMKLSASETNGAWRIRKADGEGAGVLTIGDWLDRFAITRDAAFKLPDTLAKFEITAVGFGLDMSDHLIEVTIEGSSTGATTAATIRLSLSIARGTSGDWGIHAGGTLQYGTLRFDLTLDAAGGTRVIAVLADDAPATHDLVDLADAFTGFTLAPSNVPLHVSLQFQAALAAFDRPAAVRGAVQPAAFEILALDLGAGANLTVTCP